MDPATPAFNRDPRASTVHLPAGAWTNVLTADAERALLES